MPIVLLHAMFVNGEVAGESFSIVTVFLISANCRTKGTLSGFFNLFVSPTFDRCCPRHTMTSKER
jgi:hypothetical protein